MAWARRPKCIAPGGLAQTRQRSPQSPQVAPVHDRPASAALTVSNAISREERFSFSCAPASSRASNTNEDAVPPSRKRNSSNSNTATKRRSPSGSVSASRRRRGFGRPSRAMRAQQDQDRKPPLVGG